MPKKALLMSVLLCAVTIAIVFRVPAVRKIVVGGE